MSPRFLLPVCALMLALPVGAQVTVHTGPYASAGSPAHKTIVRDAAGQLYCVSVTQDASGNRPLALFLSTDQGQTWNQIQVTLNDATSGLNPPNPTNVCAMAIDDLGVLHVTWASYYYPSNYAQYYRSYDPVAGTSSAIVNISSQTGGSATRRTGGMDIAIDANNTVWLAAHGSSSWVEVLAHSTQPYAAGGTFTSVGAISPSASAQTSRIAVDASGLIHCVYYRNTGSGIIEHRYYDPVAGIWGTGTMLGNNTPSNDYYGMLSADGLGNVHALYGVDLGSGSTWLFRYKIWNAGSGWSAETVVFDATPAQYAAIVANRYIFALACDESTGKAFAVYRDITAGGELRVFDKSLIDTAFNFRADLTPAAAGAHEYYIPAIRGALYPAFNQTGAQLDITWRQGVSGSPPYALMYHRWSGCTGAVARSGLGCADAGGTLLSVNYLGAPCLGQSISVGSNNGGGIPFFLVMGFSDALWFGIALPLDLGPFGASGCTAYCSQDIVAGPVGSASQLSLPIPSAPSLAGLPVHMQNYVIDFAIPSTLPLAASDLLTLTLGG